MEYKSYFTLLATSRFSTSMRDSMLLLCCSKKYARFKRNDWKRLEQGWRMSVKLEKVFVKREEADAKMMTTDLAADGV